MQMVQQRTTNTFINTWSTRYRRRCLCLRNKMVSRWKDHSRCALPSKTNFRSLIWVGSIRLLSITYLLYRLAVYSVGVKPTLNVWNLCYSSSKSIHQIRSVISATGSTYSSSLSDLTVITGTEAERVHRFILRTSLVTSDIAVNCNEIYTVCGLNSEKRGHIRQLLFFRITCWKSHRCATVLHVKELTVQFLGVLACNVKAKFAWYSHVVNFVEGEMLPKVHRLENTFEIC